MLLSILRKTLAPFGLILVIVVAILLARSRFAFLRVIPSRVFILVVAAVLMIWLVILLVRWITEKRRASAIEDGILDQAQAGADQATPARRAEIQDLNRNLAEAMAILKKGPQGKKALYSLPWYMIIGPPAVGKTTAIVNSNLNFPGMTTAKRMRGAGGTRNCDWWFSTDAILLDTAGRYADGVDRGETEVEWFTFLDLLKSHRKRGPIDGLILAYSIEDLLQKDEVGVIDAARELRQRMDEILDRLGWTFPVYVLFTKCDLISGFADYFSSLSPLDRHQVWGAVYSPEPEEDQRAAERFAQEFDLLLSNLRNTRPYRMSSISRSEDWGRVFMFPEEFANLKDKMVLLIETLFEANPYRKDVPIFRGTYFSSGKQLGKPFDLVVRKIQSMLGVRAEFEEAPEQEEKEDAYFVRDLFAKVLKTDRDLVRVTGEAARRRSRVALFVSTGFLVLGLLACVYITFSYTRLRAKMDRTKKVAEQIVNQEHIGTAFEELPKLDRLRKEITGSWRSFPLVVTDAVHNSAQGVYHRALTERILNRIENRIARELENASELNGAQVRRALRAELMLLMPENRKDIGWNAKDLTENLYAFGLEDVKKDAEARQQLKELVAEFLFLERPIPDVTREAELLRGAHRLAETHTPREFFRGIIYEASETAEDLTLDALVPDQSILRSGGTIRAAFTRVGWKRSVQPQVRDVQETVEADNLLIELAGGDPTDHPPSAEELLGQYRALYPEEWIDFIESVRMGVYRNCEELEDDLRKLRRPGTSPLFSLLREATVVSSLESEGLGEMIPGAESIDEINVALRPLKHLVEKTEEQPAPLEEFREELKSVYRQVEECAKEPDFKVDRSALRGAKRWLDDFVEPFGNYQMAGALKTLLMRPLALAENVLERNEVADAERQRQAARQQLQTEWLDAVSVFRKHLDEAYPFSNSKKKADPDDVIELFGPNGALARFSDSVAQSSVSVGPATKRALRMAERIQKNLRMNDDAFEARFTLQALAVRSTGSERGDQNRRKIDTVILTINGVPLEDRLTRDKKTFAWRSDNEDLECSLVLKNSRSRAEVVSIDFRDTIWSLCLLFDKARITDTDEGRTVVWAFPDDDIEVEFLLTTREDAEPFFISSSAFRQFSLRSGAHE